jgi:AraC family transcriptional regulator of adaptative response / DNA-3-methyladenine glycosylase II
MGQLGIVRQRVAALQALAVPWCKAPWPCTAARRCKPRWTALRALPGVGDWTAQVIAMRVLAWPDAWPASDIGLMNALGSRDPKYLSARAEAWRPWRAYAVMRLWHQLEDPT